ncbi:3-oxoacyl-[acyl-carrier-protein] reductase [Zalerion maritima]|uniref:3-oxoacyl-[acyl-carrier-protein] reductase n=1 Tax=Zalerion maritima TaxID=339359 RepID=A0AAD5WLR3_9PEZI|nr:3-oxoacyl-[acyl-carrier-protein] reductase [Zalerion maritima]
MVSLLKGTAFITGAAGGIGKASAFAFAQHGVKNLTITDINATLLAATNKELKEKFPDVQVLEAQVDVREYHQVSSIIRETGKKFGRLDIAVNNAGIGGSGGKTHEIDWEEWQRVLDVDLHGVWRCQREELKLMVDQKDLGPREGRGRIINVASMYGIVSPSYTMNHTAYTAAKHAVMGLTKADANSYGRTNIRINAVCPGYVRTPLVEHKVNKPDTPIMQDVFRQPFNRLCTVEEIADSIVFLASPMSSFMQGVGLVVDGGFTTQ